MPTTPVGRLSGWRLNKIGAAPPRRRASKNCSMSATDTRAGRPAPIVNSHRMSCGKLTLQRLVEWQRQTLSASRTVHPPFMRTHNARLLGPALLGPAPASSAMKACANAANRSGHDRLPKSVAAQCLHVFVIASSAI